MPKPSFTRCVFIPRRHVEMLPKGAVAIDVSSYAEEPYCRLSPMWPHGGIPVPGMPNTTSDTVEGIWQGLKIIRGKIATRYFSGMGQKRGGKPAGHQFGKKTLDIVEARYKIYRPAYEWMLEHCIDPAILEEFISQALQGITQHFYDMADNGDINNGDAPLAHASILVQYLNRRCVERVESTQ
jgi:hypothetical protein